MTPEDEKLVRNLRGVAPRLREDGWGQVSDLILQLASRIEALAAELAEVSRDEDENATLCRQQAGQIIAQRAQLTAALADRRAMLEKAWQAGYLRCCGLVEFTPNERGRAERSADLDAIEAKVTTAP